MVMHDKGPVRAANRKPEEIGWDNFWDKLRAAIILMGGIGNDDMFNDMSLKEIYKHLHPNGIQLAFMIDEERVEGKTFE